MRDLTRRDKAMLVAAGIKGILQKRLGHTDRQLHNINFDLEKSTKLKASQITLKFLAFKPSGSAFYSNASPLNNTSIYNEVYRIPRSFYFTYKFFDYQKIKSESVTYKLDSA